MRIRVLGPIEVFSGGWVSIPPKQRAILAVLAVRRGRPVSVETLIDEVWGGDLPRDPANQLHVQIKRLRDNLGDRDGAAIRTRAGAYELAAETDLQRFEELATRGTQLVEEDPRAASELLAEALDLWHGPAFGNAPAASDGSDLVRSAAEQLEGRRLSALEVRIEADLALGRHADLTADLQTLVTEYPLRERFWAQYLLALYRSGRQADALEAYQRAHDLLDDELGIEPGTELRELHQRILRAEPSLATGRPGGADRIAPRQLPAAIADFRGRDRVLADLSAMVHASPITVIAGTGGVGKTALAVHGAQAIRNDFPDGQLFVNLRGYDQDSPIPAFAALEGFCRSLGADQVPGGLDERVALYRSLLADKRALVVLDNARAVEQVRPLLPGSGPCRVVVTSRDDLAGLVARDGARRLVLRRMDEAEAHDLLETVVGAPRLRAEPDASRELVDRCAGLPLALRIAAERLLSRPRSPIGELVSDLADEAGRLDRFDMPGDPTGAARAVFSWSYNALSAETARVFRLLGSLAGPDIDERAAANLAGVRLSRARTELDLLARAHLLEETGDGRFSMHDLLKAYAVEQATAAESSAALVRLLDYYLNAVSSAVDQLDAGRPRIPLPGVPPPTPPAAFADSRQAVAWLEAECANLVASIRSAAGLDLHAYPWQLCYSLWRFFDFTERVDDWIATHQIALAGSSALGDRAAEAGTRLHLGLAYAEAGRFEEAIEEGRTAATLYEAIGDRAGRLSALNNLSVILVDADRPLEAREQASAGIVLARTLGDERMEALLLCNLVGAGLGSGTTSSDVDRGRRALEIFGSLGDPYGESVALEVLASAYLRLGSFDSALDCAQSAVRLRTEIGDQVSLLEAHGYLVRIHLRAGAYASALAAGRTALSLARSSGSGDEAWIASGLALVHALRSEPESARAMGRRAYDLSGRVRRVGSLAEILNDLGETCALVGDADTARSRHSAALELAESIGHPYEIARARTGLSTLSR